MTLHRTATADQARSQQQSVSSSAASKLATLDWPRPPSPAGGTQRPKSWAGLSNAGLGATSPYEALQDSKTEASGAKPGSEGRHRADLWAVRSEIEKEKLRHVAPFPFFGRAMRFQDESGSGALQISDDGRFSYSTVTIEGLEPGERPPSGEPQVRRVTTYEGILMPPPQDQGQECFQAFSDPPMHSDGVSSIEGTAMVKYEIEDSGGRAKLVGVVRGQFSFSITVTPYFQPSFCTVQPSPRKWPPARKKELPYVGTGLEKKRRDVLVGSKSLMLMKAGDVRSLMQEHRRAPKLKFSKSATQLAAMNRVSPFLSLAGKVQAPEAGSRPPSKTSLMRQASHEEASFEFVSSPSLPELDKPTQPAVSKKPTVADWRDFYRQRAENMISSSRD